jgi:molybdenum cofactor cytidylyltransferase
VTVSCVILAAGTSSRLGESKQLLEIAGKPLLQHVLDVASGTEADEIVVVLGHDAARIQAFVHLPERARTVVNETYEAGQASSLRAGLAAVAPDAEAALVVLGDQPTVAPASYRTVLAEWRRTGADVVRPRYEGVPGHPVVISRGCFEAFAKLEGDTGARALLDDGDIRVREVNLAGPPPVDIDTRGDYEALRKSRAV